jgi:TraM recognition site of TraD and TraG
MGKSSLLVSLCRRVAPGSGLILFDPLGETARSVRQELAGVGDRALTWVDPSAPVSVNALAGIRSRGTDGASVRERRLNDIVHSLRRVRSGRYTESSFWGPRLEEMLTRALDVAAEVPDGTLEDAHTLLGTGGRGFRALPSEALGPARELADRIRARPDDAEGARRLLHEVVRSPTLLRLLCSRNPTTSPAELVTPGRVVLVSGDAALVGESIARYLLSVVLALVWSEILARPGTAKTFVVLDEAQWFVHESLAEMLRLGRRRNVHVVLASQSIASLPENVAEAVWTNVADFVAFRGSPEEAREFSRAASGVAAHEILGLPRGTAAVLLGKGGSVDWVRTARLPANGTESRPARATTPTAASAYVTPTSPAGVLRELRRIAKPTDSTGVVRVSLNALRTLDPSGGLVRRAGGLFGRQGAIVRAGRDRDGPFWWIDLHRAEAPAGDAPLPTSPERAENTQPS